MTKVVSSTTIMSTGIFPFCLTEVAESLPSSKEQESVQDSALSGLSKESLPGAGLRCSDMVLRSFTFLLILLWINCFLYRLSVKIVLWLVLRTQITFIPALADL